MKRFILGIGLFFTCLCAHARHIPQPDFPEKPLLGDFSKNPQNRDSASHLYLLETQQGYILFLADKSCQPLYPLGYVDGMGLYNGYFGEHLGLDPMGTYYSDSSTEEEEEECEEPPPYKVKKKKKVVEQYVASESLSEEVPLDLFEKEISDNDEDEPWE